MLEVAGQLADLSLDRRKENLEKELQWAKLCQKRQENFLTLYVSNYLFIYLLSRSSRDRLYKHNLQKGIGIQFLSLFIYQCHAIYPSISILLYLPTYLSIYREEEANEEMRAIHDTESQYLSIYIYYLSIGRRKQMRR